LASLPGYRKEALVFGRYLLGEEPSAQAIDLYVQAMEKLNILVAGSDERLLRMVLNFPWMLEFADAGLALVKPSSVIRRKLLIMLAILETLPQYTSLFFPERTSFLNIFFAGCRASFKAVFGIILVKLV
jgi:hypothetical protein